MPHVKDFSSKGALNAVEAALFCCASKNVLTGMGVEAPG